ncbi:MAG TPA: dimethyl sulfoxide reductase anchor subunit [Burkholderiaceae bacterium]|nr:dimethyl sulfoxide reductase anchor subunit [Burkholderiaceae bacterium]
MRPEPSVILLTTLIGAGQGLFLAIFTAHSLAIFDLVPAQDGRAFDAVGSAIALALTGAGLIASFFHLGRPERAWRAITQWRTSWLSREVIVLPAFMFAVFAYALAQWSGWRPVVAELPGGGTIDLATIVGLGATLLAFALFVCTGMIYACLPFLREWHSPLTTLNFVLLGCASGFTLAAAFSTCAAPDLTRLFTGYALAFTLFGLAGRGAALIRNRRLKPKSTLQTAIGIKHPRIVQKSMGFQSGSFNTHEFFHGRQPGTLRWVKWAFLAAGFAVPALLLAAALAASWPAPLALLAPAFAVQFAGLVAERWFFFADANHPQNLYYQAVA